MWGFLDVLSNLTSTRQLGPDGHQAGATLPSAARVHLRDHFARGHPGWALGLLCSELVWTHRE